MAFKFKPNSLRSNLNELQVDEQLVLPAERLHTAKVTASDMGFMLGRRFRVQRNNEARTVIVTRIS